MDANKPKPGDPGGGHDVAAEPDYVSARTVVGFAVILAVVAAISMALMAALFQALDRRAEKRDEVSLERAGLESRPVSAPPRPRLQIYPARHWLDFREAEAARLGSYGWMDRATGVVHVPIDRAMDLIAERGVGPLPAAPVAMPAAVPTPGAKP